MNQSKRHNKSIKETKEEDKCSGCVMNTICTFYEKEQRHKTSECPSSIKNLPSKDNEKTHLTHPTTFHRIKKKKRKEANDMIPVIKMEYWDGSKFIVRTDKAGYKKILCKLRVKMRSKLLNLPIEEQIEIARSQKMLKRTEEMMSEKEYLKIDKG